MRIELEGVSKAYLTGQLAVDAVDLDIDDGEFRIILGPSGCGKSTLLRIVAGLERPTTGRVVLDGNDATDTDPGAREVAFAFQEHALYPKMTVRQNISFPLRMAGFRPAVVAARVDDVARRLSLDDVLDRRPSILSGGQQQRVSLARSIIRRPRAFLMDEPLSNLDAHLRAGARSLIQRIQRSGPTTTLFVTHDQEEAMTLGDRITVMRAGRVIQTATPSELYDHPPDVFTARFVGSPPMNLFAGSIVDTDGGSGVQIGSAVVGLPESLTYRSRRPMSGQLVAVGIRAESLSRHPDGELQASVSTTESLGAEQIVHAVIDAPTVELTDDGHCIEHRREGAITARVPTRDRVGLWEPFGLRVDSSAVHLFDLPSGTALTN